MLLSSAHSGCSPAGALRGLVARKGRHQPLSYRRYLRGSSGFTFRDSGYTHVQRCSGDSTNVQPSVLSGTSSSSSSSRSDHDSGSQLGEHQLPKRSNGSSNGNTAAASSGTPAPEPVLSYSDHYRSQNTPYGHQGAATSETNGSPEPSSDSTNGSSAAGIDVEDAIAKAQQALAAAETSLSSIEQLQSNQPPSPWTAAFKAVRSMVALAAMALLMVFSHASGLVWQWTGAFVGALGIAGWGYQRNSLSKSGAIAAVFVGCATLACSLRFGATLLAFYVSSSKLTSFKEELKEGVDDQSKKSGQRDWKQVCCNALVPSLLSIAYGVLAGCVDVPLGPTSPSLEPLRADLITLIMGAFLGYYACCCGDTWASELGVLSKDTPRLITTLRPVRRGTNGGVTLLGLSSSIAGGLFVGLVFYAAALVSPTLWIFPAQREVAMSQWKLIPLGLLAGLFGSLLDSLLGATVQYTGYNTKKGLVTGKPGPDVVHISGLPFLDNNLVNLTSASLTSLLTAFLALRILG